MNQFKAGDEVTNHGEGRYRVTGFEGCSCGAQLDKKLLLLRRVAEQLSGE
jgi:hypothetical protein